MKYEEYWEVFVVVVVAGCAKCESTLFTVLFYNRLRMGSMFHAHLGSNTNTSLMSPGRCKS